MTQYRVRRPCLTSWAYFRGWRDRILRGHTVHSCDNLDDLHIGDHTCSCGARCNWIGGGDEQAIRR